MKKIVYICDLCRKQTDDVGILAKAKTQKSGELELEESSVIHLCGKCFDKALSDVCDHIGEEDKPEAKKKTPARPVRVDIDMGKVRALKDAGWSYEKIADEFGVSPQTIYSRIKKEKAAGAENTDSQE